MKIRTTFFLIGLMLGLLVLFQTATIADPLVLQRRAIGSVAIETPVGSVDRPQDNITSLIGDLHLTNLVGPVGIFASGQLQLHRGLPYDKENKFRVGIESPLGFSHLVAYGYFERRFDTADNRFMVGCRWGFNTPF